GRLGLGEAAAVPRVGDLHQALPAVGGGIEQRVVAEPRDLDPEQLGRPDDERSLRHRDPEAVDGERHHVHRALDLSRRRRLYGHLTPHTVEAAGSNGQPPISKCLRYSSLKSFTDEWMELVAPSPSAQNERPRMLSAMSVVVARSSSVPWPFSSR